MFTRASQTICNANPYATISEPPTYVVLMVVYLLINVNKLMCAILNCFGAYNNWNERRKWIHNIDLAQNTRIIQIT